MEKEDLTVQELKGLLQSHLGDKSSTELFQNLMCARQGENENPQQFIVSLALNKGCSHFHDLKLLMLEAPRLKGFQKLRQQLQLRNRLIKRFANLSPK